MREPWETNRIVKKRATRGSYYYWGCDACFVYDGIKCPVCGRKEKRKRRFKGNW